MSSILKVNQGGTGANLIATGGASQVLKQVTAGGVVTVGQLAGADLSNGTSGSGAVVLVTSATLITPALGTPTALVGTNITGTASGLTAGNVTTNANLTGPITSVGNATSVAAQTGTGSTFVMNTSPTLITPTLGVATATTVNKLTITAPATGSTLTIADGKTLTVSNSITLAGTDATTMTFPTSSATLGPQTKSASVASSDVTTTLGTNSTVTGLSIAVLANKKYKISGTFWIGCDNTGGVKLGINGPAGSAVLSGAWNGSNASFGAPQLLRLAAVGTTTGGMNRFNGATGMATLDGYITTAGTAGNVTIEMASVTATQTSTVFIGSTFSITEVQ